VCRASGRRGWRGPAGIRDLHDAEVGDLRADAVLGQRQQHIRRLQVAVDHPRGVRCPDAAQQADGEGVDLVERQRAHLQQLLDRGAGHMLHQQRGPSVHVEQLVDGDDMRMAQRGLGARLGAEALLDAAVAGREHLEREGGGQRRVPNQVDRREGAFAQAGGDDVAVDTVADRELHRGAVSLPPRRVEEPRSSRVWSPSGGLRILLVNGPTVGS